MPSLKDVSDKIQSPAQKIIFPFEQVLFVRTDILATIFFLFLAEKVSFILSAMKHKCRRWKLTFSSEIGFAIENFAHKS